MLTAGAHQVECAFHFTPSLLFRRHGYSRCHICFAQELWSLLSMVRALQRYASCRMTGTCGQQFVLGVRGRRCTSLPICNLTSFFTPRTHQLRCSINSARGLASANQSGPDHNSSKVETSASKATDSNSEVAASDEISRLMMKTCRLQIHVLFLLP